MDDNTSLDEDEFLPDISSSFVEEDVLELIERSKTLQEGNDPHDEHLAVLRNCFGHQSFRPMQWKIINSIINDRRDNCVVMATGYGKSLCYQYPSVFCGGVTLVISPLISLMEDQVLSLSMTNISACLLGSAQTKQNEVINQILEGKYNLVYLTPEFCCGDLGTQLLRDIDDRLSIMLIAVDEAHCVSMWGHDFRFQYRQLGMLKSLLPHVPILAVTATATPRVRNDIITSLQLKDPQVLCSGFDRPNLHFSVNLKGSMGILSDLKKVMVKQDGHWNFVGSTIVYCITRKQTETVAELLNVNGIKCAVYHAGLTVKQRKHAHEQFVRDKINTIVATIAFGMGIDKPDVRNVIHYGAPRDIESYYQEVGRAGRDGQPSKCIAIYNTADFIVHKKLREMNCASNKMKKEKEGMARELQTYLELKTCRRQFILYHFERQNLNKNQAQENCCDNCDKKIYQAVPDKYEGLNDEGLYDFTEDSHTFLAAVKVIGNKCGISMSILFLRGSKSSKLYNKHKRHPLYGSGKHKSEEWWKCIGHLLEREKYLDSQVLRWEKQFSYNAIHISTKGERFLCNVVKEPKITKILVEPLPEMLKLLKRKLPPLPNTASIPMIPPSKSVSSNLLQTANKISSTNGGESAMEREERMKLYRLLMNRRTVLASKLDCMPYMIASNEALMKMAQMKPYSIDALRRCQLDGFTEAKIMKFGEEFLRVIPPPPSIEDVLLKNPLPGVNVADSALETYRLYCTGLPLEEIARQRCLAVPTVFSHLCDCIKMGKIVKLIDLTVTETVRRTIVSIIQSPPINSDLTKLQLIKGRCPETITYNQILTVIAFLQVCDHLAQFNYECEDFKNAITETKERSELDCNGEGLHNAMSESIDNGTNELDSDGDEALNALVDEIEKNGYLDEISVDKAKIKQETINSGVTEPPEKKKKFSRLSLLDSPPRKFS